MADSKVSSSSSSSSSSQPSFWEKITLGAKELGEKTKAKANTFKLAADEHLQKAKESETWQKTKAGAGQAWDSTRAAAIQAHSNVKTAIQGEKKYVTFLESKLGMTLARDDRTVRRKKRKISPH